MSAFRKVLFIIRRVLDSGPGFRIPLVILCIRYDVCWEEQESAGGLLYTDFMVSLILSPVCLYCIQSLGNRNCSLDLAGGTPNCF